MEGLDDPKSSRALEMQGCEALCIRTSAVRYELPPVTPWLVTHRCAFWTVLGVRPVLVFLGHEAEGPEPADEGQEEIGGGQGVLSRDLRSR